MSSLRKVIFKVQIVDFTVSPHCQPNFGNEGETLIRESLDANAFSDNFLIAHTEKSQCLDED